MVITELFTSLPTPGSETHLLGSLRCPRTVPRKILVEILPPTFFWGRAPGQDARAALSRPRAGLRPGSYPLRYQHLLGLEDVERTVP